MSLSIFTIIPISKPVRLSFPKSAVSSPCRRDDHRQSIGRRGGRRQVDGARLGHEPCGGVHVDAASLVSIFLNPDHPTAASRASESGYDFLDRGLGPWIWTMDPDHPSGPTIQKVPAGQRAKTLAGMRRGRHDSRKAEETTYRSIGTLPSLTPTASLSNPPSSNNATYHGLRPALLSNTLPPTFSTLRNSST